MFNYCPSCKGDLQKKENYITCTECSFLYYFNPVPATAVILINNRQEVLFTRRGQEPKKGMLDLPGGFIDFEESAEDGARREVKEELNITVEEMRYIGSYTNTYACSGYEYQVLDLIFVGKIDSDLDSLHLDKKEIAGVEYIPITEIPYDKLAFESHVHAFNDYLTTL